MQQQQQLPRIYIEGERLGRGMGGQVFRVLQGDYGKALVMKVVNKTTKQGTPEQEERWANSQRTALIRELRMLEEVRFKHGGHTPYGIVRGFGLFESRHQSSENRGQLFLIMEGFMGNTLAGNINSQEDGHYSEYHARSIVKQLVEALKVLHARTTSQMPGSQFVPMVHRDVKPANIVLSTTGRAVLVDFGQAVLCSGEFLEELRGAPGHDKYMAPEFMKNRVNKNVGRGDLCRPVDEKVDCWAAGITMMETVLGMDQVPFHSRIYPPEGGHLPDCHWARTDQTAPIIAPKSVTPVDIRAHVLSIPDDVDVEGGRPNNLPFFHVENEGLPSNYVTEHRVIFRLQNAVQRPLLAASELQTKQQQQQAEEEQCPDCPKPIHCPCGHRMERALLDGVTGECLPDALCSLSADAADFLAGLLTYDSARRMSMSAARRHPYFTYGTQDPGDTRFYYAQKFNEQYRSAPRRRRQMVVFLFSEDVEAIPARARIRPGMPFFPVYAGRTLFMAVPFDGSVMLQSDVFAFMIRVLFYFHYKPVKVFEVTCPRLATDPAHRWQLENVNQPMRSERCVYIERIESNQ